MAWKVWKAKLAPRLLVFQYFFCFRSVSSLFSGLVGPKCDIVSALAFVKRYKPFKQAMGVKFQSMWILCFLPLKLWCPHQSTDSFESDTRESINMSSPLRCDSCRCKKRHMANLKCHRKRQKNSFVKIWMTITLRETENINITCASHEKRKMAKVVSKTSKTSGAFAKTFLRQMEGGAQPLQMFQGETEWLGGWLFRFWVQMNKLEMATRGC